MAQTKKKTTTRTSKKTTASGCKKKACAKACSKKGTCQKKYQRSQCSNPFFLVTMSMLAAALLFADIFMMAL